MKYWSLGLLLLVSCTVFGCTNRDTYEYLDKDKESTVDSYDFIPENIDQYDNKGITIVEGNKYVFAIQCNGKDSYIKIPYNKSLSEGSFEAHIYMDEPKPSAGILHNESHSLRSEDDRLEHEDDEDTVEAQFPKQKWVHVVSTWNSKTINLYYDGRLVSSTPRKESKEIESSFIFVCSTGRENSSWHGKMEGIKVHRKCLSSDEVRRRHR